MRRLTRKFDPLLAPRQALRLEPRKIEFMSNSNSNLGGGYFYHHCATLAITADPSLPVFNPPLSSGGASGMGGASAANPSQSSGCSFSAQRPSPLAHWLAWLGSFGLMVPARRRALKSARPTCRHSIRRRGQSAV